MATPKQPPQAELKRLHAELRESLAHVKEEASEGYQETVALLRGFAGEVAAALNAPGAVQAQVTVELGHLVSDGQEHRIVIRAPDIGLSDFLLRAFVPPGGVPVVLDAYAEGEQRCASRQQLVEELVAFSRKPEVRDRLIAIRTILADASLRAERKAAGQVKARTPAARAAGKGPKRAVKG